MTLLTADDVLKKTFQTTKFREGYDQDEVDDFLDEIVNTLRTLQAENSELKAKVAGLESGEVVAEEAASAEATAVVEAVQDEEPEPAPVVAVVEAPPAYAPPTGASEPESATGMLQLAQRLHDEYVRNGQAEGDRLVAEARAEAERLVGDAEGQRNRTLQQLETEQATLESKISQLRNFERDYRLRLKGYLGSLVEQLDAQSSVTGLDGSSPQL